MLEILLPEIARQLEETDLPMLASLLKSLDKNSAPYAIFSSIVRLIPATRYDFETDTDFFIDSFSGYYALYLSGLGGIALCYQNYFLTLIWIEIMYLGITVSFIIISNFTLDLKGQIYAILLIIIAAAESAVGLGILIVLYRFGESIKFEDYQELKG